MKLLALILFLSCPLWAVVNCTDLDTGSDAAGTTTHVTGPITPLDNALILIAINSNRSTPNGGEVPTSVTYNALAMDSLGTVNMGTTQGTGKVHRVSLYRALGTSLGTGSISIVFPNPQMVRWVVDQCTGVDSSGTNGSGAIAQVVTNSLNSSLGPSTVTLAAFANAGNGTYGASAYSGQAAFLPGTGMATIGDSSDTYEMITEWAPGNVSPVTLSWPSASFHWGVIGVEINAAPASIPSIMIGGNIEVN